MKMNTISPLKAMPIIAALAIGLALAPTASMADNGNRGNHKGQSSQDYSRSHSKADSKKQHRRDKREHGSKRHNVNRHDRHSNKTVTRNYYGKPHKYRNNHKHYGHDHHRNNHSYTNYVVHDYVDRDRYVGFDDLRFMIGLHSDNFDIIFRD